MVTPVLYKPTQLLQDYTISYKIMQSWFYTFISENEQQFWARILLLYLF